MGPICVENRRTPCEGLAWATTHGYCSAAMSTPKSLVPLRFSLVGPGRVGSSLAHWLTACGAEIVAVAGRNAQHRDHLARQLGAEALDPDRLQTDSQDLLVVAVSDPAVASVANQLAGRPQAEIVLHTSGALDAAVLAPLQNVGSSIGAIHPLMAFPKVLEDPHLADGKVFALDGDPAALGLASRLALSWNGHPVRVTAEARPIYHLGASLAAGGVITLLAAAIEMANLQDLPPEIGEGYLALARGAIDQASRSGAVASAITGPLARGDLDTFRRQLQILEGLDPDLATAVENLASLTLRFAAKSGEARTPPEGQNRTPRR